MTREKSHTSSFDHSPCFLNRRSSTYTLTKLMIGLKSTLNVSSKGQRCLLHRNDNLTGHRQFWRGAYRMRQCPKTKSEQRLGLSWR